VSTFDLYAAYYDLLYEDKGYDDEAQFVARLIREHAPHARSILELGCGTGKRAVALARQGFDLAGIDLSPGMVERANARLNDADPPPVSRISFDIGDVRTARFDQTFDAVVSLFHVMSYQVTNSDLIETIRTASSHLAVGGVFVFDCWYGPAVLTIRPEVRVKRCENSQIRVFRVAEPAMHADRNVVEVHYTVRIEQKSTDAITQVNEVHPMRYLFYPEVEMMLAASGLEIRRACEWMSGKPLDVSTWSATFVAVKQ
jgi:SAM-dependent methyltransferase